MRIPFIPRHVEIHQDRYNFIKEYRGGGYVQISSSIYWLLAFGMTYLLNEEVLLNFYIFGGIIVPILSFIISKLLKLKSSPNQYSSLIGFASTKIT